MSDEAEDGVVRLFMVGKGLSGTMASLCQGNSRSTDPLTDVVLALLTSNVRVQLTETGLQPLQGRDWVVPYYHMHGDQKKFLMDLLSRPERWMVHESCITWRRRGAPVKADTLEVLTTMCSELLDCKSYSDHRSRLALCNIVLQRVQASVQISQPVQAELNLRVFSRVGRDVSAPKSLNEVPAKVPNPL